MDPPQPSATADRSLVQLDDGVMREVVFSCVRDVLQQPSSRQQLLDGLDLPKLLRDTLLDPKATKTLREQLLGMVDIDSLGVALRRLFGQRGGRGGVAADDAQDVCSSPSQERAGDSQPQDQKRQQDLLSSSAAVGTALNFWVFTTAAFTLYLAMVLESGVCLLGLLLFGRLEFPDAVWVQLLLHAARCMCMWAVAQRCPKTQRIVHVVAPAPPKVRPSGLTSYESYGISATATTLSAAAEALEDSDSPLMHEIKRRAPSRGLVAAFGAITLGCVVADLVGVVVGLSGLVEDGDESVRRPLRPFRRPFWLRFTYVPSVLVKKY
jgi:hypothetical protein